jgi:hypothetical protein
LACDHVCEVPSLILVWETNHCGLRWCSCHTAEIKTYLQQSFVDQSTTWMWILYPAFQRLSCVCISTVCCDYWGNHTFFVLHPESLMVLGHLDTSLRQDYQKTVRKKNQRWLASHIAHCQQHGLWWHHLTPPTVPKASALQLWKWSLHLHGWSPKNTSLLKVTVEGQVIYLLIRMTIVCCICTFFRMWLYLYWAWVTGLFMSSNLAWCCLWSYMLFNYVTHSSPNSGLMGTWMHHTVRWPLLMTCSCVESKFQTPNYRISRPIRRTLFPEKCDLNSTCVLCAEGKYYFQT